VKCLHKIVLISATLVFSWLAMQAVHELGHVLAAVVSGARVTQVVLNPLTISQTRLAENPHPLLVAWMGPVVGVAMPLAVLAVARVGKLPGWYIAQFFAGFCLVANGAYLAFGAFGEIGDAGDLLRHGAPLWLLWLFGAVTIPLGLWLWNGLGRYFGLGPGAEEVSPTAAYVILALATIIIVLELILS
jgi:hypothetical protein